MREIIIGKNESGQRLNKFLMKYLNSAPSSFVYKMLRKKNIKLNDKKADGSEIISEGDTVKLFLSDETVDKFRSDVSKVYTKKMDISDYILFEDEDIIVINKPSGVLSQKAEKTDYSVNEAVIDYAISNGIITLNELNTFKPSICNRLDRNTSGIIFAGLSLKGTKELTKAFKDRTIDKYYYTIVKGEFEKKLLCDGYLYHSEDELKSRVISVDEYNKLFDNGNVNRVNEKSDSVDSRKNISEQYSRIKTAFYPLSKKSGYTLLGIKLITGKTHQIRAHLKSLGYPVIGDMKYGDDRVNAYMKKTYGLKTHLLHAGDCIMKEKNIKIHAPLPEVFIKICEGEGLRWQHGIPED